MKRSILVLAFSIGGAACEGPPADVPPPPPPAPAGPTCLAEGGAVDVLFVVDNSSSITAPAVRIATSLDGFLAPLLSSGLDYHVGVVTSDIADGGELRVFDGDAVPGCESCRFLTRDVGCDDVSVNVDGLTLEEAESVWREQCEAWLVLSRLVSAGTDGSAFEAGFATADLALGGSGAAPGGNAGFRRDGAPLHIVFISDEDEGAKRDGVDVHFYMRLFEGLAGKGNDALVTTSAITGLSTSVTPDVVADLCPILATTFDDDVANDDPRAAALVEQLRTFEDGCAVSGAPEPAEQFSETGGRFIELACRTGGVFSTLCAEDLTGAMSDIAALVLARCVDGACIASADCENGDELCDAATASCVAGECLSDSHCTFGSICEGASCLAGCVRPGDCPLGMSCSAGACTFACAQNSDCAPGEVCVADECVPDDRSCVPCSASCEPPDVCSSDATGFSFCATDCSAGQACSAGFTCTDVVIIPPAAPFCTFPEVCVDGLCSRNTTTSCVVSEDCPEGGAGSDCHIQNGGRFGSCALDDSVNCQTDQDCPGDGDQCIRIECRGGEGDSFGHCSCTRDSDCPVDVCLGADLSDPAAPVQGRCELSGRDCFENFECDVITCVDGGCLIGAVCTPANGASCQEIISD